MRDFDDFYAASYADLTVQVYAYFGDLHEAQDVVQEAFCRALARWRQVSGYDDPPPGSGGSPGTSRPAAGGDCA